MGGDDEDDPRRIGYYLKGLDAAGGLGEAGTPFETGQAAPPSLESVLVLYRRILAAHGFSCDMTGERFEPVADPSTMLEVTAIRPLALGGGLAAGNFLCLAPDAATAFRYGSVTVGSDFGLLVDLSRIEAGLLDRLNLDGRLILPEGSDMRPDVEALAWHRHNVFGRD